MMRRTGFFFAVPAGTLGNPTKIPYGSASFAKVARGGYFWRDNTSLIANIAENDVDHQLFLRPPRFGKSFALDVLHHYIDVKHKDVFDELFKDTEIHHYDEEHKNGATALRHRNKYHVMRFDFTVPTNGDAAAMLHAFQRNVVASVVQFGKEYEIPTPEEEPMAMVKTAAQDALRKNRGKGKVFVLVDEYDRFANKLMFERPDLHGEIVAGQSGDVYSSPVRSFFETLKTVPGLRSYTTGITPVALADASGANMIKDLTHDPDFGEMCGLREDDVRCLLRGTLGDADAATVERVLGMMRHFFNGYRFKGTGADYLTAPLFNTQMCLYFCDRLQDEEFRDLVVNQWSNDFASADITEMIDRNVRVSENVVGLLAKHGAFKPLAAALAGTSAVQADAKGVIRLRELMQEDPAHSLDRIASFMFHHGLVTLAPGGTIKRPNEVVANPVDGLLVEVKKLAKSIDVHLPTVVKQPTEDNVWKLLTEVMAPLTSTFNTTVSEVALVAVIEGMLITMPGGGVTVHCEIPMPDGTRPDLYLKFDKNIVVLEFKRIRPENKNLSYIPNYMTVPSVSEWPKEHPTRDDDANLMGAARAKLHKTFHGKFFGEMTSVHDVQCDAAQQCRGYMSQLAQKYPDCTVRGFTAIHWTQDAKKRSACIVHSVP